MKRLLLALLIPLLASGGQSIPIGSLPAPGASGSCFTPAVGTGWWKTKEGSGTTIADSVGSNNAMLTNTSWAAGISPLSNVLTGTASTSYAVTTSLVNYDGTAPFTINIWEATTSTAFQVMVSDFDFHPFGYEFSMIPSSGLGGDAFLIIGQVSSAYLEVGGCSLPHDGSLHMITATYDGGGHASGVKIYEDGSLCSPVTFSDTGSFPVTTTSTQTAFANRSSTQTLTLDGSWANVLMTPAALNSTQISCLFTKPYGS